MTVIELLPTKAKDSAATESHNNGAISKERYEKAASALRDFKSTTGRTWDEIGREVGAYSGSAMSAFAGGKYPIGNSRNIVEAVDRFTALVSERRSLLTETRYVDTTIARGITAAIKKAELLNKIVVIQTESGCGKTTVLQHYAVAYPRSVYLKGNPTFRTKAASTWALQVEIAAAIDLPASAKGLKTVLYQAIRKTLRNSGRLLIIDEAQFLEPDQLDLIRCLHEEAKIPVVLSGNHDLYERATGFTSSSAFTQFRSRTLRASFSIKDIQAADVELIAEQFDIEIGRDAHAILLDQARMAGGFRRLTSVLQLAQIHRSGAGKVRKEHVLASIKELAGGDQ